jgi:hypothetical protein
MEGASPRFQAAIVVLAPANAKPLRCIGFLKNLDLLRSDFLSGDWNSFGFASEAGGILRLRHLHPPCCDRSQGHFIPNTKKIFYRLFACCVSCFAPKSGFLVRLC